MLQNGVVRVHVCMCVLRVCVAGLGIWLCISMEQERVDQVSKTIKNCAE